MKIRLNIEKKHLYVAGTVVFLLSMLVFVSAYGTTQPQVFGHSPEEIGPGSFLGDYYGFNGANGVQIDGVLGVGKYPQSDTAYGGTIYLRPSRDYQQGVGISTAAGGLGIYNNIGSLLFVDKDRLNVGIE